MFKGFGRTHVLTILRKVSHLSGLESMQGCNFHSHMNHSVSFRLNPLSKLLTWNTLSRECKVGCYFSHSWEGSGGWLVDVGVLGEPFFFLGDIFRH